MLSDTDKELVTRSQQNDATAFQLLFERHRYKIAGVVRRFVSQREDIEEIVQDTFVKAYRGLPRFRLESKFSTWLYTIAVNTAKNHLAKVSRKIPTQSARDLHSNESMDDAEPVEWDDPEGLMVRDELQAEIYTAFEALPDDLRHALTLREYEGLSYSDIAEIMECPVGTVRSRIHRAREFIFQRIDVGDDD